MGSPARECEAIHRNRDRYGRDTRGAERVALRNSATRGPQRHGTVRAGFTLRTTAVLPAGRQKSAARDLRDAELRKTDYVARPSFS
jgi:hypothetical protein